ncbi:MAG: helix-turn-helix domain-containing protein [Verrucomicrobiaceae bacterium]|nr:MAG: helix-turn-helix domain-containing protein [Verrucomicrobiaceae bacterium]
MNLILEPTVLRWARDRAGLDPTALAQKLKVDVDAIYEWEQGGEISFHRIEKLAKVTHTPMGLLFLKRPPDERLPIQDFRTVDNASIQRPSPELLDTVYQMQRRQEWMREFLIDEGELPLPFVGTFAGAASPELVAADMRRILGLATGWANSEQTWMDALVRLRREIEALGVLVVINGVVGNNSHRCLDPEEFRGFALCDAYAPLIFVNNADAKAAQMFTLIHELAHLWIGEDGV